MTRKPESERAVRHGQNEKANAAHRRGIHDNVQTFPSNYGRKEQYVPGSPSQPRQEFSCMEDVHKAAGTVGRGPTKKNKQ
jgi:hypothetical protein